VASARAGNVIGGGDWAPDRLVPDIVRAFTIGQPVTLRNPGAVRPWQHVLEPLSGYLTLAEHLYRDGANFEGGWNFGPSDSDAQPVGHLVAEMARLWGEGAAWHVVPEPTLHEAHLLRLDSSKARALLHWRPRWTLDQALANTVQWYHEFYTRNSTAATRECTLRQIECYTSDRESAAAGIAAP
jgi:CDP-glucose 4,6-dehydratase